MIFYYKDLKEKIQSRQGFNEAINDLKALNKESSQKVVTIESGEEVLKWYYDKVNRNAERRERDLINQLAGMNLAENKASKPYRTDEEKQARAELRNLRSIWKKQRVTTGGDIKKITKESMEKMKKGEAKEGANLAQGLSTGILLYCIGTLSILGPVNSALMDDHTYLFTNATLDLVTSMALSATYGIGMVLAAPVLLCWQGAIYALAKLCGNVISPELLCEMSIVGGILIAASGLSILDIKDCKTLNLLPALFVPVLFFVLKSVLQLPI